MLEMDRFAVESGRLLLSGSQLLVKGTLESGWPVTGVVGHAYGRSGATLDLFDKFGGGMRVQGVLTPSRLVGALRAASDQTQGAVIGLLSRSSLRSTAEAVERVVQAGWRAEAGAVLVILDDGDADRVGVDPRAVMEQLQVPLLEPSSPQQLKDWIEHAITLSRIAQGPVAVNVPAILLEGGGTVSLRPNRGTVAAELSRRRGQATVKVDVGTGLGGVRERIQSEARELGINRIWNKRPRGEMSSLGFIATGQGLAALTHALTELDLVGEFPLLAVGQSTPIDGSLIRMIGQVCQQVVVVEPGRGWLEREVHQALSGLQDAAEVYGKRLPDDKPGVPVMPVLHPSDLIDRLASTLIDAAPSGADWVQARVFGLLQRARRAEQQHAQVPERTPTFAPGSIHRDTASVLGDLQEDLADAAYTSSTHNRSAIDLRVYHDTDASRHIRQPPFDTLAARPIEAFALGGSSTQDEPTQHHVLLMSDETLAGAGRSMVAQAFEDAANVTFILTRRSEGFGPPVDLKRQVKQLKSLIPFARRSSCRVDLVDPFDRPRYRHLLEQTVLAGGVSVLLLDGEPTHDLLPVDVGDDAARLNVATAVDEFDPQIVRRGACPSLRVLQTPDGFRYQTDRSVPMHDAAYRRLNVSPAFERVRVVRAKPAPLPVERLDLSNLPEPVRPIHAAAQRFHIHIAGVAGRGVRKAAQLLLAAGEQMGYDCEFLAPEPDALYSAVANAGLAFTRPVGKQLAATNRAEPRTTAMCPRGSADLVLGLDLLEAARAVTGRQAVSDPSCTAVVVNMEYATTIRELLGQQQVDSGQASLTLAACTHPDRFFAFNAGKTGFRLFKQAEFLPVILTGMAFQQGLLPVTTEALEQAVKSVWSGQARQAVMALRVGRMAAVDQAKLVGFDPDAESPVRQLKRCRRLIALVSHARHAQAYEQVTSKVVQQLLNAGISRDLIRRFARRAADCCLWGGPAYAEKYVRLVAETLEADYPQRSYAMTVTVIDALAKVMLIKDEIYIARLLTHPAKQLEDRRRYDVSPARGDKLVYEHDARPTFTIMGRVVQLSWRASQWQLALAANARWLRRVLPGWHKQEVRFRDWYIGFLKSADWQVDPERYDAWRQALKTPLSVAGFRASLWPQLQQAKQESISRVSGLGEGEEDQVVSS